MDTSSRARPRRERVNACTGAQLSKVGATPHRNSVTAAPPGRSSSAGNRDVGAERALPASGRNLLNFIFRPEGYLKGTGAETPRNTRRRRSDLVVITS